jgi:gliding motility-associated-like protein
MNYPKHFYKPIILILALLTCTNINGQSVNWGIKIGGTGFDFARFTIVDDSNNFYVYGMFNNTITLDSAGNPKTMVSAGQRDYFLVKYNCNRVQQWRVRVGGSSQEGGAFAGYGLALSKNGNIFISGSFAGNCSFISSNGTQFISSTSGGADDIFTAKLNNNGIFEWVANYGGTGWDEAGSIAVDDNENVYTLGFFSSTCTFRSAAGLPTLSRTALGSTDVFITKHNSNGVLQYATVGGSTSQDMGTNARADKYGNLYVTGIFSCCSGGNGTFGSYTISNASSWGGFVAKLNSTGQYVWVKHMGSAADEAFINLEIDHINDKIYAVGHFNGSTTITSSAPYSPINLTSNGGSDILVANFDTSGGLLWANKYGGTGNDIGWGIDIGNDGNPIIGGEFENSFIFGSTNLTATGGMNAMAGKLNVTSGVAIAAGKVSGNGLTYCRGLSHNNSGNVIITGYFTQTTNAGPSVLTSAGVEDAFVASFQFTDTTIINANNTFIDCNDSTKIFVTNKTQDIFRWFRNDTLILVTDSNFIYAKSPGVYYVVNLNNCAIPDTSNRLTITSNLIPTNNLQNISGCKNDSIQLNNTSNGTNFSWTPAHLFSNPNILNPKFKADTTRYLYLLASNGNCQKRDSILVTPTQVILGVTPNTSICLGDSIQLTASGANNYAWSPKFFISDTSIANPFVKPTTTTVYRVRGSINTCTKTDSVRITVNFALADAGADTSICLGDTLQLLGTVNNLNLIWYPNHRINEDTLQFPRVWPNVDTSYVLSVTNNGCTSRDTIRITVKPLPIVVASIDSSICFGDTLELSASGASSYQWQPNLNLNNPLVSNPKAFPNSTQKYFVTGTTNGCSNTDSVQISVVQVWVNVPSDTLLCFGDTIQLNSSYIGTGVTWFPTYQMLNSNSASPKVWPSADTTYFVRAQNGNCSAIDSIKVKVVSAPNVDAGADVEICQGSSITLAASGANTYQWWPNIAISDTNIRTPIVSTNTSRTYYVKGSVGSCFAIDSVQITFVQITAFAGNDTLICPGDTITLNGAASPAFGNWIPNWNISNANLLNPRVWPSQDTIYILSVTNSSCKVNDTIRIRLRPLPPLNAGSNQTICIGDTITLNATGALVYQWLNNYNISNVNIPNPRVYPAMDTSYVVGGLIDFCPTLDTVRITVLSYPVVDAGPDETICYYETTVLNGTVSNATAFMWQNDPTLSDAAILNPTVNPNKSISTYILNASNQICKASDTVVITEAPLINAGIQASPIKGNIPLTVTFTNQSIASAKFFDWDMDDGNTYQTRDTKHTFNQVGKFNVTLMVEDSFGCIDSAEIAIDVLGIEGIKMPNAFTPQGDGLNDLYAPVYIGDVNYIKLYIYSRWGELIYETTMPGGAWWDGKFKGEPCPDGVYVYRLEAQFKSNNYYEQQGTVTLLR